MDAEWIILVLIVALVVAVCGWGIEVSVSRERSQATAAKEADLKRLREKLPTWNDRVDIYTLLAWAETEYRRRADNTTLYYAKDLKEHERRDALARRCAALKTKIGGLYDDTGFSYAPITDVGETGDHVLDRILHGEWWRE